ncbi:MAG: hypothetical protein JRG96_06970 [Deltaproteobacteria bacterium]|nr:hypothetical protein [Deltaproteobacteria bacterium]MBW2420852.1 hypothetical protein [Deltaproteobacteria bacterium]
MKLGPVIAIVVVALFLAVGGGVYYLITSLDSLVKSGIESYGSEITGSRVRVSSVRIQLASGRGTIRGLRIANPKGFSSSDAFSLGEITLDIDPGSLTGEPVVVDEIVIRAPLVHFELDAKGDSNIEAIKRNVARYQGGSSGGGDGDGGGAAGPAGPLLSVTRFTFEEGKVAADTAAMGGDVQQLELPPLEMTNLGGSKGASPDQIGKAVMNRYTAVVGKVVARYGAELLIDEKLGGQEGEAAKKLLRGILR